MTRMRSVVAIGILAALVVMTTMPTSATEPHPLADALSPGRPSCHARAFGAAELDARPARRVAAIALERTARDLAAERKWGAREEFDGTPIVSATLRVRLRGDPVTHSARLACARGDDNGSLVCESPACVGGEVRIAGEGRGAIAVSIGGKLKSGRFIGHYIHLDEFVRGPRRRPDRAGVGGGRPPLQPGGAPRQACQ